MILSKKIFRALKKEEYDLLWVLVPPNSFVKDACRYKEMHKNTKLIFDLIDLWPETMPISRFKSLPPFSYWKAIRDKYLNLADEIVTECDLYHEKLPKYINRKKIHTIYLAREIKEFNLKLNMPKDKIAFCYLGSINNIIDIPAIYELILGVNAYLPVQIHIVGDGEKKDELINSCESAGAEVFYHGKVFDSKEKNRIFETCHYGLNIMKDSVFVGLTMKSMDYFEAGLPIINNIQGDTWDIIEKYKIGINLKKHIDFNIFGAYKFSLRNKVREFYESNLGVDSFNSKLDKLL